MESTLKTADPKKYMREYMKARYHENKQIGANISNINYYKRTGSLTKDDIIKYGECSASIIKAKKYLDSLKEQNSTFLVTFLHSYLEEFNPKIL